MRMPRQYATFRMGMKRLRQEAERDASPLTLPKGPATHGLLNLSASAETKGLPPIARQSYR